MSQVKELTDQSFEEEVKSGLTLVDFWAPWCGPCRVQGPIVDKVASKVGGQAKVTKLNVDDAPNTAQKYGILSIPTLILFKDGEKVQQWVGVQQEDALVNAINAG